MIILKVNGCISDQDTSGGHPHGPRVDKVSYFCQKLINEVLLVSIGREFGRRKKIKSSVNVVKLLKLLGKTCTPEDGIEQAKNAVGEARKMVQISFSFIDYIISLPIVISNVEMISLTIYLTLLRQNIESNPGMVKKNGFLLNINLQL